MYVNVDAVNVREEATTASDVVTSIEQNTAVTVTGETGDWYAIKVNGVSGYVMKQYLSSSKQ